MSTPVASVFRELHRVRRYLRDLQSEIDLGPRVLKIHLACPTGHLACAHGHVR